MEKNRKQRILTGLSLGMLFLIGNFAAPSEVFSLLFLAAFTWAATELVRILRHWAPEAPLGSLPVLIPIAALGLMLWLRSGQSLEHSQALVILAAPIALVLTATLIVMASRAPLEQGAVGVAFLTFSTSYFAVPAACIDYLHRMDPMLVFVVTAIVGFGDTAAYFIGSWIGKRHIAPRISPRKTWEGSIAGVGTGVLIIVVFCLLRFHELQPRWILLAVLTAIAAQLGDLLESMIKRGAGVKDSSDILPGHGGLYDRVDAMLFAVPVFVLGLWLLGLDTVQ